jgi:DNA (cytosine-5)-methyltransferase 1
MSIRIGSFCSGYAGLDEAVQEVFDAEVAWVSDIDAAANTVLEARYPNVRNLGDITSVDWDTVPAVDILTAGFPCQPWSKAGNQKGADDERHLWPYIADAIGVLRPRVVIMENVVGLVSLGLGDVTRDLALLGYDARWGVVRASDIGAPHQRARLFILATPTHPDRDGHGIPLHPRTVGRVEAGTPAEARQRQRARGVADTGSTGDIQWGTYADAIERWESITGRPAPRPDVPGAEGPERLNPQFAEWLMGLEPGHVTGHGLPATKELALLGNGIVPAQAAHAIRLLIEVP